MVLAPELFVACGIGQADRPIVERVARRIAPAIIGVERYGGKRSCRARHAVRPPEDAVHAPAADRGRAIALGLDRRIDHAALSDGTANVQALAGEFTRLGCHEG